MKQMYVRPREKIKIKSKMSIENGSYKKNYGKSYCAETRKRKDHDLSNGQRTRQGAPQHYYIQEPSGFGR